MIVESRSIPINSPENSGKEEEPFRVVDKRPFANADPGDPANALAPETPRYPSFVEELMAKTNEAERRYAERVKQMDQEISRTRNRLEADYERRLSLGKQDIILPFLEILDNLERALRAASAGSKEDLIEGVRMTAELFAAKLRAHAIERLQVLEQSFDPNISQAVGLEAVSDPQKDGVVIEELLPGYRMGESLLRPAQVRVGRCST
jgi:molecular chaperone GrpE